MNGQEHYAEAERLIHTDAMEKMARDTLRVAGAQAAKDNMAVVIATAQVHATLALAAATTNNRQEARG